MSTPLMADHEVDDLPRTLRREKEARQREAREREAQGYGSAGGSLEPTSFAAAPQTDYRSGYDEAPPATVRAIQVPFFSLMAFFLKAVIAAIPALILLGALLWLGGQALQTAFPELVKMKILISFPQG